MKNVLSILVVAGVAAAAGAQITSPVVSWEASSDNGATWTNNLVIASAQNVLVRGRLSWTGSTGGTALASVSFDGVITGNVAGESASGFAKPVYQTVGAETVTAYSLANQIKISNSLDTDGSVAGGNTTWLTIGADAALAAGTNFSTANPITFLTYSIAVDGSSHTLTISSIMNNAGTSSSNYRAVRIYNADANGNTLGTFTTFNRAQVGVNDATIQVIIPTPGTLALAGLGGLAAARRRR
jgi:hypothetical protein